MSPTETNRANAQHSTGPQTPAGKTRSSLNALRHGLTSQIVVMPSEDLEAYQRHLRSFETEYHPQGTTEQHLVQSLADTAWRLNRLVALETNLLTLAATNQPAATSAPADVQNALAMAAAFESHLKALSNLSIHSQRLSRQFERTLNQLLALQATRRAEERQQLNDLAAILEMHEAKGETYNPAADGFVFSDPQIAAARTALRRSKLAATAQNYRPSTAAA